jgi:hypothetical protein
MVRAMTEAEIRELSDLNYREALREQSRRCGGVVIERNGLLLAAGAHPHPTVNAAIRVDSSIPAADVLKRAREFFGDLGHGYAFATKHVDEDGDLRDAALDEGLIALLSPPAMVLDAPVPDRTLPAGVEVRVVSDEAGVGDFGVVSARAWKTYGLPPETPASIFERGESLLAPHIGGVVAYRDGEPVSCALVLLSHGIAGIYWVGTVEEARGAGIGEAVTRAVANLGFEHNARLVILQASPMGEPIYRRMGFREIFKYQLLFAA